MSVNTNLYKCLSRLAFSTTKHLPTIGARTYCLITNLGSTPRLSKLSSPKTNKGTNKYLRFSSAITRTETVVSNAERNMHFYDTGTHYTRGYRLCYPNSVFYIKRTPQPYSLTYLHNNHLVIPQRQFTNSRVSNTKVRKVYFTQWFLLIIFAITF